MERVVSVVQNAKTNYETDPALVPIIQAIEKVSGVDFAKLVTNKLASRSLLTTFVRYPSQSVMGALPSNEGRGYITNRLIRRSVMHGRKLGISRSFLSELVPVIADIMGLTIKN